MERNKKNSLLMTAALTGLLAGTAGHMNAAPVSIDNSNAQITSNALKGKVAVASFSPSFEGDKHSCKGKNDCKGEGGCKAGDNGCKGKNSCKGKGGCATDGSKHPELA